MAYVGEIRADCPLHLMDFHNTSEQWAGTAARAAFEPSPTTPREAP